MSIPGGALRGGPRRSRTRQGCDESTANTRFGLISKRHSRPWELAGATEGTDRWRDAPPARLPFARIAWAPRDGGSSRERRRRGTGGTRHPATGGGAAHARRDLSGGDREPGGRELRGGAGALRRSRRAPARGRIP